MKIKHLLITCALLFSVIAARAQTAQPANTADTDRGYMVKVGDTAPADFELQLTDGTKTSLKQLAGKIVILQFTASWCSVCREEMPHLEKELWQVYKDKNVVLIGVDRDEPLQKVIGFRQAMNISYPLALDPGAAIFARFANKKSGVTRNVVIDRNGRIVYLTRLYNQQEFSAMLKVVDALANKPTAAIY
ncbi:TlpA family protein disulfide reductase [Mucilaginibacter phyllosphaerae]|uniref:Peroxiredoxin n=1 Tax=Mucilaginibacter phyllosphaerae TaxID=1812349 RepID=A0A4Y8A9E3_9SPHI|nr:TlpA disulfide reductase family protein [Mucilaginibacter phyllosphaerae]MBB3969661.1 peroxiredoxin [Mucilaginibacter phyllosphaerae]TEW65046.1 TlpA family protein disulfide reductase [Mucilaginibacter phyllosphaerae]GGH18319.1 protein disulfide-isomerase [Mucilaginibacter phyllosphaerae]